MVRLTVYFLEGKAVNDDPEIVEEGDGDDHRPIVAETSRRVEDERKRAGRRRVAAASGRDGRRCRGRQQFGRSDRPGPRLVRTSATAATAATGTAAQVHLRGDAARHATTARRRHRVSPSRQVPLEQ